MRIPEPARHVLLCLAAVAASVGVGLAHVLL